MSSSSAILSDQYWVGSQGFRDASEYTLFKKRQGIRYLYQEPVRPPLLQSLQNRTSTQFAVLDCLAGGCPGGFPQVRLTSDTPI
jgi:hypothetical protein